MILTIGHSNLSAEDFDAALDAAGVDVLVDIRSHPTSKWPQFREEALRERLGCRYEWWPGLGGWSERFQDYADLMDAYGVHLDRYTAGHFPKQHIAGHRPEGAGGWASRGLYDYQFFMTIPEFVGDTLRLADRGRHADLAIMCCESCWWKCHRGMVSDFLVAAGVQVRHVLPRFRKVKEPRCVVNFHNHELVSSLQERLAAYHPDVAAAWERFRELTVNVNTVNSR